MKPILEKTFQKSLLRWFKHHGRKDLPWQQLGTPYHVWISEIMLQQTQVKTVAPYYTRFVSRFPSLEALANASMDTVLQHWSGLGYYARARNLHQSAQIILSKHEGIFPNSFEKIISLPGVGRSTAGAILSFGFHKPYPILDGNIKRVLARVAGITDRIGEPAILKQLWKIAEHLTPTTHTAHYNQAMMDIGALICREANPHCNSCPLRMQCYAYQYNLQGQIPVPALQKKKNQKNALFLLCCHEDKILLEKRPPKGVWGGLWSFPELPFEENPSLENMAKQWIKKNAGEGVGERLQKNKQLEIQSCTTWSSFIHAFTHLELAITPIQVVIASPLNNILLANKDLAWFQLQEATSLGLPSPSRNLIQRLQSKQDEITI